MTERSQRQSNVKRLAGLSMLLCLATVMGYLEALMPVSGAVPGMRLGLANYVIVIVLYLFRAREAYLIALLRVLLVGFLFMNFSMILYSLAGTLCAVSVMCLLKKTGRFSMVGVSIAGGIMHNMAQLMVAYLVLPSTALLGYLPWLLLAGMAAGALIGIICRLSFSRVKKACQTFMGL